MTLQDFEDDASKVSGLHFAKEALREKERDALALAERMTERVRAVLDLHVPETRGWKVGTPVSMMTCRGCRVETPGGGAERLFDQCPTRAAILALP